VKHPDDLEARLVALQDMVATWSRRLDLVSPRDLPRLYERHIQDSLRALPLISGAPPGPCVDVGSGAGFPGVPLAIASDRRWVLLEPRLKRAAFLEEAVRELELDSCEVVRKTAQEAARDPALAAVHAVAIARALAPPAEAAALCAPLVVPGGAVVIFVGTGAEIPPEAEEWAPGLIRIQRDGP
jgi:16S rRNA (guanine527-N7)-methyltransferase